MSRLAKRLSVFVGLLLLLAVVAQAVNTCKTRELVCGSEGVVCGPLRASLSFDVLWRVPDTFPLQLGGKEVRATTATAVARKNCAGDWRLDVGARVDVGALPLVEGSACADANPWRARAVADGRVPLQTCSVTVRQLDVDWRDRLTVTAEVAPEATPECAAAIAKAGAEMRELLAGAGLRLEASYGIEWPEFAPIAKLTESAKGWFRAALEAFDTSQKLSIVTPAASIASLELETAPQAVSSPALDLELVAAEAVVATLPDKEREHFGDNGKIHVHWTLDHEGGVEVDGVRYTRAALAPRTPGQGAPTPQECATGQESPVEPARLLFVEADDGGQAVDERQLAAVFAAVDEATAERTKDAIVVVFVHGWQHSAATGDSNVCSFAELMRAVEVMEAGAARNRAQRPVIGVYVGWPGALYANTPANLATTFWNRLAVADEVGGAQNAVLPRLVRGLADRLPPKTNGRADLSSALVVAGHSLGARALFHAVRDRLEQPSLERRPDVVLLVNPAFSASLYHEAHEQACVPGPPRLLFSSETDTVTRQVYPAGQSVSYSDLATRFIEHVMTAANFPEFVTHRLDYALLNPAFGEPAKEPQTILRGFERVPRNSGELYEDEHVVVYGRPPGGGYATENDKWYEMVLSPIKPIDGDCRFGAKVIEVATEIVPNHNGIFTPPFMEYVVRVLNQSLRDARD